MKSYLQKVITTPFSVGEFDPTLFALLTSAVTMSSFLLRCLLKQRDKGERNITDQEVNQAALDAFKDKAALIEYKQKHNR